jgi:hypothetical protein
MKTLALTLAFALASAGCLSTLIPDPKPASHGDMATVIGTGGNGDQTGTDSDMSGGAASTDSDGGAAGAKLLGDLCTVNGDCQSALCEQFAMGTVHRCTKPCTVATQATDCPAPSDGTCTNNGYCKFDQ